MSACIIGWAHTPFGKHSDETVESLVTRVAREAVEHAGLEASDIDEIYLGHFNAGFSAQDFTASLVLQADDAFRFKPATRVENACATGSAAVHQGIKAIRAGAARRVLVVGVEQMTTTPGPQVGANLLRASYLPEDGDTPAGFAGVFGKIADGYFLIALSNVPEEKELNLQLMRQQSWIDIPIVYKSGRRALVTMERGFPGDRAFVDAIATWNSVEAQANEPSGEQSSAAAENN